jgi:hypothetical protein
MKFAARTSCGRPVSGFYSNLRQGIDADPETFFTGAEQDNYLRMVVSYWDLACAPVKQGVLNKDLYTTNGEHVAV